MTLRPLRPFTRLRALAPVAVVAALVAVTLPAAEAGASVVAPSRHLHLVVDATGAEGTTLSTVEGGSSLLWGIGHVAGPTTVSGVPHRLDVVGVLDYVDGSGVLEGSATLSAEDGSLGMDMHARATVAADGSTSIRGTLRVISSQGRYAGLAGSGVVTAVRAADVPAGGPVRYTIDLDLRPGTATAPVGRHYRTSSARSTDVVSTTMPLDSGTVLFSGPVDRQWGSIRRTGTSVLRGIPVTTDMRAEIDYRAGTGSSTGWWTLTAQDGSQVVMHFRGWTRADAGGGIVAMGRLSVVRSTGRWRGLDGAGTFTATRNSGVPSALDWSAHLRLR